MQTGIFRKPLFFAVKTRNKEPIQILIPSTLHLVTASLVLNHCIRYIEYHTSHYFLFSLLAVR